MTVTVTAVAIAAAKTNNFSKTKSSVTASYTAFSFIKFPDYYSIGVIMKILVFGSCNIDFVYDVESIVAPGETVSANELQKHPGGKGLNQAIAIARAGGKVFFAGKIGENGLFLKKLAEKNGINTEYLKVSNCDSGHAIIQVDKNGENSIIVFAGANSQIDNRFCDDVLKDFESGDIIVLQNEISNLEYIIEKSYKKGMKIFLNPSPITNSIKNIDFNKLYCLIVNETEAKDIFGITTEDDFAKIITNKYPKLCVVMTLGKNGSMCVENGKTFFSPAIKTNVVDTTGAGDTFTGYFIHFLTQGNSSEKCLHIANTAASIAVSKKGAASSIPKFDEIDIL